MRESKHLRLMINRFLSPLLRAGCFLKTTTRYAGQKKSRQVLIDFHMSEIFKMSHRFSLKRYHHRCLFILKIKPLSRSPQIPAHYHSKHFGSAYSPVPHLPRLYYKELHPCHLPKATKGRVLIVETRKRKGGVTDRGNKEKEREGGRKR